MEKVVVLKLKFKIKLQQLPKNPKTQKPILGCKEL
jgi:hypothetical protein